MQNLKLLEKYLYTFTIIGIKVTIDRQFVQFYKNKK